MNYVVGTNGRRDVRSGSSSQCVYDEAMCIRLNKDCDNCFIPKYREGKGQTA